VTTSQISARRNPSAPWNVRDLALHLPKALFNVR
jgi:hypothetical protein